MIWYKNSFVSFIASLEKVSSCDSDGSMTLCILSSSFLINRVGMQHISSNHFLITVTFHGAVGILSTAAKTNFKHLFFELQKDNGILKSEWKNRLKPDFNLLSLSIWFSKGYLKRLTYWKVCACWRRRGRRCIKPFHLVWFGFSM